MNAASRTSSAPAQRGPAHGRHHGRNGFLFGLGAYALWGVLPIYFKAIAHVPALDIVAHRVLWSLPFLALIVTVSRGWPALRAAATDPKILKILALSSIFIGTNWLLYVYAVTSGHIIAASFGYYLNPLANVLLGRFVLHERLGRMQWLAVAIAAAGISVLAAGALGQLWISLTLCVSFALYGLLRKVVAADAVAGLTIETALLFPLAAGWLAWRAFAGAPVLGAGAARRDPAGPRRDRFDHSADPVHRRRPATALFDARDAPVPRSDAATADCRADLRRGVPAGACDCLCRHLDRACALCHRAVTPAALTATARMKGTRRCSISSRC